MKKLSMAKRLGMIYAYARVGTTGNSTWGHLLMDEVIIEQ
jgi:hypothetical protein